MNNGCEQWWERVMFNEAWTYEIKDHEWDQLGDDDKQMLRAIYEAAILPQDEDDRELREEAARFTMHEWERGENQEEMR